MNITCADIEKNDYQYALVGYGNGCISIYDTDRIEEKAVYPSVGMINRATGGSHEYSVDCVQWYPHDTGMFMSLSSDKSLKVWDTNELSVAETFRFEHDVYSFHISQRSRKHSTVAVCCKDTNIYMCDLKTGSKSHTLRGHTGAVYAVKWSSRRENILCSASSDGFVYMWDFRKVKSHLASFVSKTIVPNAGQSAHQGPVTGLQFTNDGLKLISYGGDGLKLWDCVEMCDSGVVFDGGVHNTTRRTVQMDMTRHATPHDMVCVPSGGGDVKLCDVVSGSVVGSLSGGHFMDVTCCVCNPVKCEVYTGSTDGQFLVWDYQVDSLPGSNPFCTNNWSDDD